MNMEFLKKSLLRGVGTGIASWLIYGLVFKMLIDGESFKDALFDKDSIIFLIIIVIVVIILYYVSFVTKAKKEKKE